MTNTSTERPSKEEAEKFVEVFDKVCQYEAMQRHIRGYGAFNEYELPFPEVVKVMSWFKDEFGLDNTPKVAMQNGD